MYSSFISYRLCRRFASFRVIPNFASISHTLISRSNPFASIRVGSSIFSLASRKNTSALSRNSNFERKCVKICRLKTLSSSREEELRSAFSKDFCFIEGLNPSETFGRDMSLSFVLRRRLLLFGNDRDSAPFFFSLSLSLFTSLSLRLSLSLCRAVFARLMRFVSEAMCPIHSPQK